jgi:hypothetical protein
MPKPEPILSKQYSLIHSKYIHSFFHVFRKWSLWSRSTVILLAVVIEVLMCVFLNKVIFIVSHCKFVCGAGECILIVLTPYSLLLSHALGLTSWYHSDQGQKWDCLSVPPSESKEAFLQSPTTYRGLLQISLANQGDPLTLNQSLTRDPPFLAGLGSASRKLVVWWRRDRLLSTFCVLLRDHVGRKGCSIVCFRGKWLAAVTPIIN